MNTTGISGRTTSLGRGLALAAAGLALLLSSAGAGCGGSFSSQGPGGETHFLESCSGSCGGGLECIRGVCTRTCVREGTGSCEDLSPAASCTNDSGEPGSVAVCDQACASTTDCSSLSDRHECRAGFCRKDPGAGGPSSGGSGAGGAGGEGSGGSAGEPVGPAGCEGCSGACVPVDAGTPEGQQCRARWRCEVEVDCGMAITEFCGCDGRTFTSTSTCSQQPYAHQGACQNSASGSAISRCPDTLPESDAFDMNGSYFQGNELVVQVAYSGGCADHDFTLCYEPAFQESNPVQTRLNLIHDGKGDPCLAYPSETLRFDLTPLADAYRSRYEADGGLISTNYGLYAFGAMTCQQQEMGADAQVRQLAELASEGCLDATDCQWSTVNFGCHVNCGVPIARANAAEFEQRLSAVEAAVCGDDGGCAVDTTCDTGQPELECVLGLRGGPGRCMARGM